MDAVVGIGAFVALCAIAYGPWQWICTDFARQMIFERRDAIFDMACEGKLSFESPEYRRIRISLQKTIRYAHEVTLPRLAILYIAYRPDLNSADNDLGKAIESIENTETRTEVQRHVNSALCSIFFFTLIKSPIFMFIILPILLISALVPTLLQKVRSESRKLREFIQLEAEMSDASKAA